MRVAKVLQTVGYEVIDGTIGAPCLLMGPTIEAFENGEIFFPILVGYISFVTGLSRRGLPISLSGSALGGETMRDYIL